METLKRIKDDGMLPLSFHSCCVVQLNLTHFAGNVGFGQFLAGTREDFRG